MRLIDADSLVAFFGRYPAQSIPVTDAAAIVDNWTAPGPGANRADEVDELYAYAVQLVDELVEFQSGDDEKYTRDRTALVWELIARAFLVAR